MSWWQSIPWLRPGVKHPCISRNEQLVRSFDVSRAIETYEFVVFDTELTGLNRRVDEIVSIAAIRIKDMRISLGESFHSLVRPEKRLIGEGTLIHRITPEQIRNAPTPGEILPQFFDFCRDSVLIGHLPELDFCFLNRVSRRIIGGVLQNPCLDSMELARAFWKLRQKAKSEALPKIRSFNLVELSLACRLPLFPSHDALGDALQTACLFLYLVEGMKKLGLKTFVQFHRAGRIR